MKVTVEKLPASQIGFDIEIEGEKSQDIYDRMIKQLMQSANVPGFRKGKAPKQLLIRQIGADKIKANVLEELLQGALNNIVNEQEDIQAIGSFGLESSFEDLLDQFAIGQPLKFKATIDVHPQVALKQYKGLTVQAEKIEPKLEKVEETLLQYQIKHSTLIPVEDRGAKLGDVVTINLRAVDAEGKDVVSAKADGIQIDLDEDEFIPELVEKLAGIEVGETREATINIPEGYLSEVYRDQPVTFTVTLNALKARELPDLDDDFAQSISGKQTMVELREFLENRIVKDAESATEVNADRALVEAVVNELLPIEIPASLGARESKYLVEQQLQWLTQTPEGEKLARQIVTKEFVQELMASSSPEASDRIKRSLALAEVARLEDIKVPRSKVLNRAMELRQEYGDNNIEQELLNQIAEDELTVEQVVEWLRENSTIEFVSEGSLNPIPASEEVVDVVAEDEDAVAKDALQNDTTDTNSD